MSAAEGAERCLHYSRLFAGKDLLVHDGADVVLVPVAGNVPRAEEAEHAVDRQGRRRVDGHDVGVALGAQHETEVGLVLEPGYVVDVK